MKSHKPFTGRQDSENSPTGNATMTNGKSMQGLAYSQKFKTYSNTPGWTQALLVTLLWMLLNVAQYCAPDLDKLRALSF
jgi:hypothetical protein